jgi:pSer/pThr/pTyr-binding forkhead associated (FHA) protein
VSYGVFVSATAPVTMTFVLKVISGKYQGGEFPLKDSAQIVIGRSSEVGLVLAEDMVSRKHAKITVSEGGGKILIEDLGSTNGTFVNGEKVKQVRLKEGDRILIGTSILRLVHQRGPSGPSLEEAAAAQARRPSVISGKIEEIPLPDVLQLLHTSRKTAVLIIRAPADTGHIYLRNGRVCFASIEGISELTPVKSFQRMLAWDRGDFELSPDPPGDFQVEIERSFEALLMEGVQLLDEFRELSKELPSEKEWLSVRIPLQPPLRALGPEELDVLQLVLNHGTLREVLNRSEKDDVATGRALLQLIKKDYVRAG